MDNLLAYLFNTYPSTTVWLDKDLLPYELEDITDSHLKNIINFLSEGKGWKFFINKHIIDILFEEAYKRKIERLDIIYSNYLTTLKRFGIMSDAFIK